MARKVFSDSVTPIPVGEGLAPNGLMVSAAAAGHRKEMMEVLFSLAIPPAAQQALHDFRSDVGMKRTHEQHTGSCS